MTRLKFDIYIRATPEDTWRALTDPAITPRYRFGLSFDTDWRPGSPLTSHSPGGQGVVHDSVPGQRLTYSWAETAKPEANGGHPSTVTFELTRWARSPGSLPPTTTWRRTARSSGSSGQAGR